MVERSEYLNSADSARASVRVAEVFPKPAYNPDRNAREVRAILPPSLEFSVQREEDVYSFSTTPISARDVHDLFRSLTNTYSRPHEEQRWINDPVRVQMFGEEASKLAMLFSEKRYMQYVIGLAGRLQTLEGAWALFAADKGVSRSFLDSDKDYTTAELARGVVESMKGHPEMWRKRARMRDGRMMASDFVALREFNRLGDLSLRSLIYEEQVDRRSAEEEISEEDARDEILINIYDAAPLPSSSDDSRRGYLLHLGSNEEIIDADGEIMVLGGGRKTRIYFAPSGTPAFVIYVRHSGSITPVLRWQKTDGARTLLDLGDTNLSAVTEKRFSSNVSIVQELGSERASILLGLVIMLGGTDNFKRLVKSKKVKTTDDLLSFIQQHGDRILNSKVFDTLEDSVD